jgi:DNA processing protein
LDELSEKVEIASYKILPDLLPLEISGYIKALSGRQYLAVQHSFISKNSVIFI